MLTGGSDNKKACLHGNEQRSTLFDIKTGFYTLRMKSCEDERGYTSRPESSFTFVFRKYFDPYEGFQDSSPPPNRSSICKIPCFLRYSVSLFFFCLCPFFSPLGFQWNIQMGQHNQYSTTDAHVPTGACNHIIFMRCHAMPCNAHSAQHAQHGGLQLHCNLPLPVLHRCSIQGT